MASNVVGTIFFNADYIVIEYIDMIKSPYIILLNAIRQQNKKIREILKIEEVEYLSDTGLYEWYRNRKHQNFLIDLNRYPDEISEESLDELLESQINLKSFFYEEAAPLIILDMLDSLNRIKLSSNIIIYHPHDNDYAKKDLENITGKSYNFMNDFNEVIKLAGYNSTYFLSDINKINIMKDNGVLKFSSITLPVEYRYNKKDMNEFNMDFDELFKKHPFKLSYCRTCTEEREIEPPEEVKVEEEVLDNMTEDEIIEELAHLGQDIDDDYENEYEDDDFDEED